MNPENRAWFILALSRLALLSRATPCIFQGALKTIHIVSNNISYGLMPNSDDEVAQHLTINHEGQVCFSGYNFGSDGEHYEKARSRDFKIEEAETGKLFEAITAYFSQEHTGILMTDVGNWVMELTDTKGFTYQLEGSLRDNFDYEGTDLSDLVRNIVGMDDLYVFDGNSKPDEITKITLDYHRITKTKLNRPSKAVEQDFVTQEYTEQLIIDRQMATLEHIQHVSTGCKVSHKYEIAREIERLFENFGADDLFTYIEGNPDDVINTPNEIKNYTITIEYKKVRVVA